MDIGTPERYLQASWDILEGRVVTRVEPTAPGLLVAADAVVPTTASVGPRAVLGSGTQVGERAEIRESILLAGCMVGEGARLAGSILAPGVVVESGAVLDGAVVGRNERVAA
jgi:mannose-1-phosphate guanylyltransferase